MNGLVRRGGRSSQYGMSPMMALKGGEKVAVLGVLERIGICAAKDLTKSSFKAVTQVPKGFIAAKPKIKWNLDGLPAGLPEGLQLHEESLPLDVQGCILASEGPAEPAEIEYILSNMPSLKKVVFLSVTGVDRREELFIKFNPFLSIGKWYAAEQAIRKVAAERGIEYTIVRAGKLDGGPFYNSNREFQSALEGVIFDRQSQAFEVSVDDKLDGSTGRDILGCALVEVLRRDVEQISIVSRKEGALRASVLNHMDCSVVGKGPRVVYTPSPAEWDAAFASL